MALIKCVDCGTEVSDQAAACSKCARPMGATPPANVPKGDSQRTNAWFGGVMGFVVGGAIMLAECNGAPGPAAVVGVLFGLLGALIGGQFGRKTP